MPRRKKKDADGLYRRDDSPYWWATYTNARGRRARRSTGKTDRTEAEAVLAGWRLEASRGLGADPDTGMRSGELLGLEWDRVDLGAALIRLDAAHNKSARRRSVPLNAAARAALASRAAWVRRHCAGAP
jgi:integrase